LHGLARPRCDSWFSTEDFISLQSGAAPRCTRSSAVLLHHNSHPRSVASNRLNVQVVLL